MRWLNAIVRCRRRTGTAEKKQNVADRKINACRKDMILTLKLLLPVFRQRTLGAPWYMILHTAMLKIQYRRSMRYSRYKTVIHASDWTRYRLIQQRAKDQLPDALHQIATCYPYHNMSVHIHHIHILQSQRGSLLKYLQCLQAYKCH